MKYKPSINKHLTNLNDFKTLSDTEPIIDYIQLWTQNIPLSWCVAIADDNNRLDFNGLEYEPKHFETYVQFNVINGVRLLVYPNTQKAKLYIPSSFYKLGHVSEICFDVREFILGIKPKYEVIDTNKRVMYNQMKAKDWLISRLDLCINITNDLDLDSLEWFTKRETTIQKYYVTTNTGKKVSGVSVGKRSGQTLYTRLYKKWEDPNKRHDYLKYYTTEFFRLEYEIRRTQLIKIPNMNYNDKYKMTKNRMIHSLDELTAGNMMRVWKWCLQTRHPMFKDSEKPPVCIKPVNIDNESDQIDKKRYSMLRGLLKPYRLEYNKKYKSIMKNIETIFNDRGVVIKKDEIDLNNAEGIK